MNWKPYPREVLLAYAGGIIDGEGHIGFVVAKPGIKGTKGRINPSYRVRLKVCMCEPHALTLLETLFGGKIELRQSKNPKHRPIYEWVIRGRVAADALIELSPYLMIKIQQAKLAIQLQDRVNRKFLPSKGESGTKQTPQEELLVRKEIAGEMRRLNVRGI